MAERRVGMLKTTVRRMLKQANLGREWWSYCLSICGSYDERESWEREWTYPLFGQLVGIWKSHDKAQAKSLDDRGSVGYLLDIDIWQSGNTRIMQDGVVIKGLAPRRLDPCRYQLTAGPTLDDLEKNMPWRRIQDELGKFKWLDHTGKIYQGTPFSVEPDITSKQLFVASMMHSSSHPLVLKDTPDVTCPSDVPTEKTRKDVVQYEQPSASDDLKSRKHCSTDRKPDIDTLSSRQKVFQSHQRQSPLHMVRCGRDGLYPSTRR